MAMNLHSSIASIDIPDLLGNIVMTDDVSEKIKILQKRLVQLDAELMKIYQIKHQLPLCVLMFEEVIQKTYKEIKACMENRKNTTVTKDFLPLKSGNLEKRKSVAEATQIEKKEWMRSAQLWTNGSNIVENFGVNRQDAVQRLNLELDEVEVSKYRNPYDQISKKLRIGEDFYLPFRGNLREHPINIANQSSSTLRVDLNVNKSHSIYPPPSVPQFLIDPSKKSRRSWSIELHKKFTIACEKLGGAYVATPKQINEMMGVEGLTNDEIKSHLQKYRIQIKKKPITPSLATTSVVSVPPVISSSSWTGEDHYRRGGSLFQYSTSANHGPFIHMPMPSFSARSGYQGHID